MIVVSENLKALVIQKNIVPQNAIDEFSITLSLNKRVIRFDVPEGEIITYGSDILDKYKVSMDIEDDYVLKPGQAILACSEEIVKIPRGYMGFLQTKGSLARLFVSVHCCDSQIEPGFEGRVTYEICNMGNMAVKLYPGVPVAQLFVFQVSSKSASYNGKYNKSMVPTISNQERK